jgi:hypothetical protein
MTEDLSVLQKAQRLQGETRRLDASAKEQAEAQRVTARTQEIRAALEKLTRQIEIAQSLKQQAPAADISLQRLDDGRASLAAKGSLPSDSAFVAARRKIEETAGRLSQEIQEAWNRWTSEQLESLATSRIPMLEPDRQEETRLVLDELKRAIRSHNPNPALFAAKSDRLRKMLEGAREAPGQLVSLLNRLPLTLRDLADADIALLREHGLDGEIEVRRKGA